MRLHHEGTWPLIITIVLISALIFGVKHFFSQVPWLGPLVYIVCGVFLLLVLNFFRVPKRVINTGTENILAPADGKVVVIEEVLDTVYFKEPRLQVSIFMSPLNAHNNRAPIAGKVKFFKYYPGKYMVAWHPKSSDLNERTYMVQEDINGREVATKQIAGAVARRIRYYVKEGDSLEQGHEYGFIKFGSRLDLLLPTNVKVNVKIGEHVRHAETVVATFN